MGDHPPRQDRAWVASISHTADDEPRCPDALCRDLLGLSVVSRKNLCLTTLGFERTMRSLWTGNGFGSYLIQGRRRACPSTPLHFTPPQSPPPPLPRRDIHNYVEYPLGAFCARSGLPSSVQFSLKLFRAHLRFCCRPERIC